MCDYKFGYYVPLNTNSKTKSITKSHIKLSNDKKNWSSGEMKWWLWWKKERERERERDEKN